jgi:biopolymer transport protein ExbD
MHAQNDDGMITEINIIPLVDITLVLLIIFMVSSTLFTTPSLKVNLPKAQTGEATENRILNVTLGEDGALNVNGQPATLATFKETLSRHADKNQAIQVHADKAVSHGRVIEVIDLARASGISRFAFMVERGGP